MFFPELKRRGNVASCIEMSRKEGLNFCLTGYHPIILMSARPNSSYRDEVQGGTAFIYEEHNL